MSAGGWASFQRAWGWFWLGQAAQEAAPAADRLHLGHRPGAQNPWAFSFHWDRRLFRAQKEAQVTIKPYSYMWHRALVSTGFLPTQEVSGSKRETQVCRRPSSSNSGHIQNKNPEYYIFSTSYRNKRLYFWSTVFI